MIGRCSLFHLNGNPNVRQATMGLHEAGLLHEVVTTLGFRNRQEIQRLVGWLPTPIGDPIRKQLMRRNWELPNEVAFRRYQLREITRTLIRYTGVSKRLQMNEREMVFATGLWLDRQFSQRHLNGVDAVYCYEDIASQTFRAAKKRGITCVYDLPTLFYKGTRRIMEEEAALFPALASLLTLREPPAKMAVKDAEIEMADHVIVASSLTRRSLTDFGIPAERITVVPYGAPTEYFKPRPRNDSKFRVVFVGRVSPPKGIHYLVDAWTQLGLKDAELMLIGAMHFPRDWWAKHAASPTIKHVPPVPHHLLNDYYAQADVFVFPSLVDGFGLVLLEAMSCGVPVITTNHTGGPDILTEGRDGFVVPVRDVEALKEKLLWCHDNREAVRAMGGEARRTAEACNWAAYRQAIAAKVGELIAAKR